MNKQYVYQINNGQLEKFTNVSRSTNLTEALNWAEEYSRKYRVTVVVHEVVAVTKFTATAIVAREDFN